MPERYNPTLTPWLLDEGEFYEIESRRERTELLLRYAILAPSGRNTQPWFFHITDDGVEIYADYSRRLPVADPGDRELVMSIGAAITNLRVAAAHFGVETAVLYQPVYDEALPLAMVSLRETCAPDERLARLFPAIRIRRTNRGRFMNRPIDIKTLTELFDLMSEFPQFLRLVLPQDKCRAARLVAEGNREQWARVEFREELAEWMRGHGAADGLLAPPLAPWVVRNFDVGPAQARRDRELAEAAAALLAITAEDDRVSLVQAGEALERVLLTITLCGLQYSFFNMAIGVENLRRRLWDLLASKRPPQVLLRIGHARRIQRGTPRRRLEAVLR
jgi:hypothetical protein